MKKHLKNRFPLVLCFLMIFSSFLPVFGEEMQSNDYSSHWAKETIESALASGIVSGYPDGSFKPDQAIGRAEFFTLVNSAFKINTVSEVKYTDVKGDAWYAASIAKSTGYADGYPDGTIQPEGNISRQEAAVILSRVKTLTPTASVPAFTDASSIADWSRQAVIAALEARIMIGYPDGSFKPTSKITRAEALVAVYNGLNHEEAVVTPVEAVTAVNVSQDIMTLTAGGATGTITAVVTPENATDKTIIWTSSDMEVATVKDGVVTPVAAGTAVITSASAADGTIKATTVVTVDEAGQTTDTPAVIPPVTPPVIAGVDTVDLGTAGNFVILAKTGISSVPDSEITGDIGVSPIDSTGITGFSLTADASNQFSVSSQITGKAYASDFAQPTPANLTTAVSNMETAYTDAAGRAAGYTELYSGDLSGKTLTPGVYKWGTGVLINSDVTLNGGPDDVWIFQVAQGITQASDTKIILTGGAQAKNVFWQTAGTVSIGTGSHFEGIILSMTNITLGTNASIIGRLLAQTAVTLDASSVVAP